MLTLDMFLSVFRYRHLFSVFTLVCTALQCTYSGSSSLNLQRHMARGRVRLEGVSAYEWTIVCEVHMGSAVQ